jgi:hypothetical protein
MPGKQRWPRESAFLDDLLDDLFAETADQLGLVLLDIVPIRGEHFEFPRGRTLGVNISARRDQISLGDETLAFLGQHEVHQLARFLTTRRVLLYEYRPQGDHGAFVGIVDGEFFALGNLSIGDVIDT